MGRPYRTFAQRMDAEKARAALAFVTKTERLLALILLELMEMRGRRDTAERARMLQRAGLSKAQAAAILETSSAVLSVVSHRADRLAALASPQQEENENEQDDQARVDSVPGSAHGDLPRRATE